MKQILYFLIGFLISTVIILESYATCVYDSEIQAAWDSGNAPSITENWVGTFINGVDLPSGYNYLATFQMTGYPVTIYYRNNCGPDCVSYCASVSFPGAELCLPDTDGDGIPDDQDMYPNDPNPYSVKITNYQTIDGTSSGEHIRECYVTDRGDSYCIGADYNSDLPNYVEFNSAWIEPETAPIGTSGGMSDKQPGDEITQSPHTTTASDGSPTASNDPNFSSGEHSTGNETDNEALRGIKDNTGDIAGNTSRMGDYLKDINKAIQNMDRNIALQGSGIGEDTNDDEVNEAQAQAGKDAINNLAVSDHYNSSNFNGELTEGTDYQPAKDLGQESWFTGFFNNNPLRTAFDNSGFNMTNSTCTMTLSINGLGTHTLSLCEFDQEFQTAGSLLLALTGLLSLIIIAWR